MAETYRLRPMALTDLDQVRAWRNHPSVRDYMFSRDEISAEQHRNWFEKVSTDPKRALLVFERDGKPAGFVQFSPSLSARVADWGFYAAPDAIKGTGRLLGNAAISHAFTALGYERLCGQALGFNEASLRMHKALGFVEEGCLRRHFFDGSEWHDLILFGLLKTEWSANQQG